MGLWPIANGFRTERAEDEDGEEGMKYGKSVHKNSRLMAAQEPPIRARWKSPCPDYAAHCRPLHELHAPAEESRSSP
jgi:hypothetical protein